MWLVLVQPVDLQLFCSRIAGEQNAACRLKPPSSHRMTVMVIFSLQVISTHCGVFAFETDWFNYANCFSFYICVPLIARSNAKVDMTCFRCHIYELINHKMIIEMSFVNTGERLLGVAIIANSLYRPLNNYNVVFNLVLGIYKNEKLKWPVSFVTLHMANMAWQASWKLCV